MTFTHLCVDFVMFDLVNQGSREPQESEDNEKNKVPRFFYVHISTKSHWYFNRKLRLGKVRQGNKNIKILRNGT